MTDPTITVRMHVRSFGMALQVSVGWTTFAAGTATATGVAALCLN
jgi:hypothetical protein